jgi:hypothetical protein
LLNNLQSIGDFSAVDRVTLMGRAGLVWWLGHGVLSSADLVGYKRVFAVEVSLRHAGNPERTDPRLRGGRRLRGYWDISNYFPELREVEPFGRYCLGRLELRETEFLGWCEVRD